MNYKLIALGCKVNAYENFALNEEFISKGYVLNETNPDLIIINTCSVTNVADQKSRQIIRRERRKFPTAILVVMGCFSQNHQDILDELDIDIALGTSYRNEIPKLIEEFIKTKQRIVKFNNDTRHLKYEDFHHFVIPNTTRAYIKIEDGCNNFCTYCTIPYTRGNARSRKREDIINEIKYLISLGYKEFILTGIHTAHYGVDRGETFSSLVKEILSIKDLYRLRISSIEESEVDNEFIELLRTNTKLASHIHLPLQSGSRTVLKRMGRKYNIDAYEDKVRLLREARPDIALTTDVIVGFPGETEEEFKETYEFIKRIKFSELHVFPFSAKIGTKAYDMKDQINPKIKDERVSKLIFLSNELEKEYHDRFIGQEMEVILEERAKKENKLVGHTANYLKVFVDLPDSEIGKVVNVTIK